MLEYIVEGAGCPEINGVYIRSTQACDNADVYRKKGSTFAILRSGYSSWSIADLRGSSGERWSLRATELYRVTRTPAGQMPPPLGWEAVEGEAPGPTLQPTKANLFPSLNTTMRQSEDETWAYPGERSTLASAGQQLVAKAISQAQLAKATSEPRLPAIKQGRVTVGGGRGEPNFSSHALSAASLDSRSSQALHRGATDGKLKPTLEPFRAYAEPFQDFISTFRVVLTRPSARVPWGLDWKDQTYSENGQRLVNSVPDGSPLERWNTWQKVRGRPALCVAEGDRLIRVDGHWAFYDAEAGNQDGDQARSAIDGEFADDGDNCMVLMFSRKVLRPAPPPPPKVEVWDAASSLVIDWKAAAKEKRDDVVLGWAVCIQDLNHEIWFVVDGCTHAARQVGVYGSDTGAIVPDLTSVNVHEGLAAGHIYGVCVAVLTKNGWSAFSELSRPRKLTIALTIVDEAKYLTAPEKVLEDWPERPRCAVPSELVPGASSPVELHAGVRDLPNTRKKLLLQMVIPGNLEGLHLRTAGSNALLVEHIEPDSDFGKWNEEQTAKQSIIIHGRPVPQALRLGDLLVRANGAWGAEKMMEEILRSPQELALTLERPAGGEGAAQTRRSQTGFEESFSIDFKLDGDAVRAVEQVQWYALLTLEEGALAASIVGSEQEPLEQALREAIRVTCSNPPVCKFRFNTLVADAQRRMDLMKRIASNFMPNELDQEQSSIDRPASASLKSVMSSTQPSMFGDTAQELPPVRRNVRMATAAQVSSNDEVALMTLRKAMADGAGDDEQLEQAIKQFGSVSHAVKVSQVGQMVMQRAQSILSLWRWRRKCAMAKDELQSTLDDLVQHEMDLWLRQVPSDDVNSDEPPHNLSLLVRMMAQAEPYGLEMKFELAEAREVMERLTKANERFAGLRKIRVLAEDTKEDGVALKKALDEGEEIGVDAAEIEAGRQKIEEWKEKHARDALHDELYTAVRELKHHIEYREKPGAGSDEQLRVRRAIAGAGLAFDHPLVQEGAALLKQWEGDNLALRAEARLQSAVRRAKSYSADEPEAGDLLASAIAEVSQQGVEARYLEEARQTLADWQAARLVRCRNELELAMEYHDEDFLREALAVAKEAGVEKDLLQKAASFLQKLRWEEEINAILEKAMESGEMDQLELGVCRAHEMEFVEEELVFLKSCALQVQLNFWASEFKSVQQTKNTDGLDVDVHMAKSCLKKAQRALDDINRETGVPEVAPRTLERDIRRLQLLMPDAKKMADVRASQDALNRVLGAIERYASTLPEIIEAAWPCVPKGLDRKLVEEAVAAGQAFNSTIKDLSALISTPDAPLAEVKTALIKARLAGAPDKLIAKASQLMDQRNPEFWAETRVELEVLVALREADDIHEISVDRRFLRLQDAMDEVKALRVQLLDETVQEVEDTNMALAAERTLFMATTEGEAYLAGDKIGDTDDILMCVEHIKRAMLSADTSALEEAKTMIPEAEALIQKLEAEVEYRNDILSQLRQATQMRSAPVRDLKASLVAARETFFPPALLTDAYAKLRKKKLEHLPTQLESALADGQNARAVAFWQRGVALRAGEERNGSMWNSGTLDSVAGRKLDVIQVNGAFTSGRRGGSFGTKTWRQNPYYVVRPKGEDDGAVGTRVTVAVAEGADMPATLRVHVVRNSECSAAAGSRTLLGPDFEVIACSNDDDEIPDCSFELMHATEERPIFIVVSAATGELGPFQLVVEAEDPVEVSEVPFAPRTTWRYEQVVDLEWSPQRPNAVHCGGGRIAPNAPNLSWYRNPQFRVVLSRLAAAEDPASPTSDGAATPASALLGGADAEEGAFGEEGAEQTEGEGDPSPGGQSEELALTAGSGATSPVSPKGVERLEMLPEGEARDQLRKIMRGCDVAGDGKINKRELIKACRRSSEVSEFFGLPAKIRQEDGSRDSMEQLFAEVAEEGGKALSFEEFEDFYMKKCYVHVAEGEGGAHAPHIEKPPPPPRPLMMARLVPVDRQPPAKAAVHILRNGESAPAQLRLAENPFHHEILACSGPSGQEYTENSEVGTICHLIDDNAGGVIVMPSLETRQSKGKYQLHFYATEDVMIQRLQD